MQFPGRAPVKWIHVDLGASYIKFAKEHPEHADESKESQDLMMELVDKKQSSAIGDIKTYGGFGEDRTALWGGLYKSCKLIHLGVDINNLEEDTPSFMGNSFRLGEMNLVPTAGAVA
jgi:hypothetical protein